MIKKTEVDYVKEVIEKYRADIENGKAIYLFDSKSTVIRKACINLYEEKSTNTQDLKTIYRFFEIKQGQDVTKCIEQYPDGKLKSTTNFLRKGIKPRKPGMVELIAWLINFKPRPFSEYRKTSFDEILKTGNIGEGIKPKSNNSNVKENKNLKPEVRKVKLKKLFFIMLVLLGMLSLVWWFNTSNEQLDNSTPVTEKVKLEENKTLQEENKVVKDEETHNKNKVENDKGLEENAKPLNIKPNSLGIIIFNNSNIDYLIMQKLQKTVFSGYDASIVNIKDIRLSEIENLVVGDLSILNTTYTENLCVGKVTYNFRKSNINSRLIICNIGLFYNVFSRDGKLNTSLSISESTVANGFTELEAKNNAIKKIIGKLTTL